MASRACVSISRGGASWRMRCTFLKVVAAHHSHVLREGWLRASVSCRSVQESQADPGAKRGLHLGFIMELMEVSEN